jgi:hypothetical protein
MTGATGHVTATTAVPGAALHHEICGRGPPVALIAAPMCARSFAPGTECIYQSEDKRRGSIRVTVLASGRKAPAPNATHLRYRVHYQDR